MVLYVVANILSYISSKHKVYRSTWSNSILQSHELLIHFNMKHSDIFRILSLSNDNAKFVHSGPLDAEKQGSKCWQSCPLKPSQKNTLGAQFLILLVGSKIAVS